MQNEAPRILVVDDEESITQLVSTVLRYEGFEVECAAGGRAAVKLTDRFRPDLVVLDVMLPDLDGFEVYRRLSATEPRVPVLFLTAKDQPADRVHGLTLGADDYVGKPFSLEELVARVRAILRRGQVATPAVIEVGDLRVDTSAQRVERAGRAVELTTKEYALLEFFTRNAGRVIGRSEISEHVWDENFDPISNLIEVYVQRLRRKLGPPPLLHTRRGSGYVLHAHEDEPSDD